MNFLTAFNVILLV